MTQHMEEVIPEISLAIHQYYMDIINCMPNIVYWVDLNCELKGSNNNFVKLLGIENINDFTGTPYELLVKFMHWPVERVEAMKLDDMKAIFSGKATQNVEEAAILGALDKQLYYTATRVPLFDQQKQVMGLVVILNDVTDRKNTDPITSKEVTELEFAVDVSTIGKALKVLMVEDNIIAQKIEQELFSILGCEVDIAESGEAAMRLFSPGKYNLVLMDIGLQDMSGYIVSKKIREQERNTEFQVPIIALTSYEASVVKYDCSDYSMNGVITKPLNKEQAIQLLQHYVHNQDVAVYGLQSS